MLNLAAMDGNDPDMIRFPADGQAIAVAVAAAHLFTARHRLGDDAEARLAIVVEELVTNLVEHGDAPGALIQLCLERHENRVAMCLSDHGIPFDPRNSVAADLPPERGGGAGILLVLVWCEIDSYDSLGGVNRLSLSLPIDAPA